MLDDSAIIKLYFARDEQAIAATADKYGGYCTAIARNILASREDAEECVADTWLGAWNSIPPHRPNPLATFLGKITRNLSLNRFKRNSAEKRGGGQAPLALDELGDVVSGRETPQDSLDRSELVAAINEFLAAQPQDKRRIFVCRYWYFDAVGDIARRFRISENSVSVALARMREKLKKHLCERGYDL